MGRERGGLRWGPRVIDLDILFYDGCTVEEADLEIPHPRLHLRRFVLVPLTEVAPDFVHPGFGKTVRELLEGLTTQQVVEPYGSDEARCWESCGATRAQDSGGDEALGR